jgi:hypothetical protein
MQDASCDNVTHVQIVLPRHVRVRMRLVSVDGSCLFFQRRRDITLVVAGRSLPVLHLDETGLRRNGVCFNGRHQWLTRLVGWKKSLQTSQGDALYEKYLAAVTGKQQLGGLQGIVGGSRNKQRRHHLHEQEDFRLGPFLSASLAPDHVIQPTCSSPQPRKSHRCLQVTHPDHEK